MIYNILSSNSNYTMMNMHNTYNFIIVSMDLLPEENKDKYISNIKLQMGITFYNNLREYIIKKIPDSTNIKFFK